MDSLPAIYNSRTLDLEVLFHNQINETHNLMVGAGARQIRMDFEWGFHNNIYNAFVQDEIKLTEKDTVYEKGTTPRQSPKIEFD